MLKSDARQSEPPGRDVDAWRQMMEALHVVVEVTLSAQSRTADEALVQESRMMYLAFAG